MRCFTSDLLTAAVDGAGRPAVVFHPVPQCFEPLFLLGRREATVPRVLDDTLHQPALATGGIRITYDVDRAAIAQQVIELRAICEFIDPSQIDEQ